MRKSSTIVTDFLTAGCILCFCALFTQANAAASCKAGVGLTSNDIWVLAAQGDTLWMVTAKDKSLAFNMIAGKAALDNPVDEKNWWSYSFDCKEYAINEFAFGGGYAFASFDSAPNVLWTYQHAGKKIEGTNLAWPEDTVRNFTVLDAAWAGKSFFLAAQDGGLVRWEMASGDQTVFFPGKTSAFKLAELTTSDLPPRDTAGRVVGVEPLVADSQLLVVTPSRLFTYTINDSSWDTGITVALKESDLTFLRFRYVFINHHDASKPLFAIMDLHLKNRDVDTTFFVKYNRPGGVWEVMLTEPPKAVAFGLDGYIYALSNEERPGATLENIIRMYRDTLHDAGVVKNPIPAVSDNKLRQRLIKRDNIDMPEILNDVQFVQKSDTSGYLWIASNRGLFFSPDEVPGRDTSSFLLIKRAPPVEGGLKTTYARPGILTPGQHFCTFIYNLKKSRANVTIAVYDYNMDLVTTIIRNQPRVSGSNGGPLGRSTVESQDRWDGRNAQGRLCAPGIYYYRITTDSGEHAFGKIVIAR